MEMEEETSLKFERYRRDRQKLLEFIISSSGFNSSLSDINLDTLSADYVINCVNSGRVLDVDEATNCYYHELAYPTMIHSQSGSSFYTVSQPQLSRSPPKRRPPPAAASKRTTVAPQSTIAPELSTQVGEVSNYKMATRKDENGFKVADMITRPLKLADSGVIPPLGLPHLQTGLSDDDLRESAYGVLVASLVFSGIEVLCEQNRKRDKTSKLLAGLKGKKNKEYLPAQFQDRNLELLNTIRTQMEANMLEELCCLSHLTNEYATVKYFIGKIRNAREWDMMSPTERSEVLTSIRDSASEMIHKPGHGDNSCDLPGGNHLKVRLYEKLLSTVFDILEEGQILAEVKEILKLIKLTWSALGITQIIHDALYSWVLFKQFVQTDKEDLLEYTTTQVQNILGAESLYEGVECFFCTIEWQESVFRLNLVQAILLSMHIWCEGKLQDYHGHFNQKPSNLKRILTFAMATAVLDLDGELIKPDSSTGDASRRLKIYIQSSVQAAYMQVLDSLDQKSNLEGMHPLALLANAVKLIAERELTVFCPVLHLWCPEAGMISATLLHQLFWERLRPFIQGISCFSQDVKVVLAAARMLDRELTQLYSFSCKGNSFHQPLKADLDHYQIADVSASLILDWLISQHTYILDWIGRAFDLEEWEPLSSQQKHAISVVEVFRMIEETIDQFFGLNLPVNITHLQAVLSLVIHSLDTYMTKMVGQLVDKSHLYPQAPSLTRYEETLVPITRKKTIELKILDDNSSNTLDQLTISKLCVRLNTLQFIRNQIGSLEDGMRKSWGLVRPSVNRRWFNIIEEELSEVLERTMSMNEESIDELFATTFDGILNSTTNAIIKVVEFTGTKAVFWDLRESFLFQLYRGGVERARLDTVLPNVDAVLNQICGVVDDTVRDPVVSSIFQASLEAYLWVLLDGGPSRAFSESDMISMKDDLRALEDFFVADGEGLPRSMVLRETEFAHQVLGLFCLQTSSIIQMLMTASERISNGVPSGHRLLDDANTLIRILCHKKDTEASKFLKRQYRLPPSSEYEENPKIESTSSSAVISDLLKRSSSFRFSESGRSSFKSLKKKFHEAW
ncbi:protein unc-13 homolog isoform X2 [Beta vulgaris subsp. vulgaris]|uniref:protein unc-13 homolog isoform X2 n=1 Tax=Beta vulgaris subsp. vulgaris TaxID=3555 RepID=UPI002036758C|nr:protein unc-13 homolog isoform X2 [Beta vulgaris subsp. vulgaris]